MASPNRWIVVGQVHAQNLKNDQILAPATASPLWRELRWVVGSGQRRFWLDSWTEEILHGPQPVDGNLSIAQGLEIILKLWCIIPPRIDDQIHSTVLMPTEPGKLIFTPSSHSTFSIKEYIEHTRILGI